MAAIDFQALSLTLATCLLPPLKQLNRHKPAAISTGPGLILLGFMAVLGGTVQVVNMVNLSRQSWFHGGTGQTNTVKTFHTPVLDNQNMVKISRMPYQKL